MGPVQLLTGLAILTKYSFANHQISHLISPWSAILDSNNIRANQSIWGSNVSSIPFTKVNDDKYLYIFYAISDS